MNAPCVVYGASDDLIEVEGVITEEFSPPCGEDALVAFSTGVLLRVTYDKDGVWRIRAISGASRVNIEVAPADDDGNFSDRATLIDAPVWVVVGTEYAKAAS